MRVRSALSTASQGTTEILSEGAVMLGGRSLTVETDINVEAG